MLPSLHGTANAQFRLEKPSRFRSNGRIFLECAGEVRHTHSLQTKELSAKQPRWLPFKRRSYISGRPKTECLEFPRVTILRQRLPAVKSYPLPAAYGILPAGFTGPGSCRV